jgi:hypothetical protein
LRVSFLDAAHHSDKEKLRELLQSHDMTALQNVGLSPGEIMTGAALCLENRRDLIRDCLNAGATVETLQGLNKAQKETLLLEVATVSITEKDMSLLRSCLEHDILGITHFGRAAAYHGSIEAYQLLLSASLDINDSYGFAGDALICAILTNQLSMVEFLLDNGASLNYEHLYHYQFTPMAVAAMLSSPEMISFLASRGAPISNSLALHRAAAMGNIANMQSLLDAGADINEIPKPGELWVDSSDTDLGPPIHYTTKWRSLSAAKFLLDRGADPNLRDFHGRDLLQRSVKDGETWGELEGLLHERLAHPG